MEFFGRRHLGKGCFEARPATGSVTPGLGQLDQVSPLVAARTETGEKLIDPNGGSVASLRHLIFFLARETTSPHHCPWFLNIIRLAARRRFASISAGWAHCRRQPCAKTIVLQMRARGHRGDHLKWLAESPQCWRAPCVCNKRTGKTHFGLSPVLMAGHLKVALRCTRGFASASTRLSFVSRPETIGRIGRVLCKRKGGMISRQTLCVLLPRLVGPFGCGGPITRTDNQSCKPKAVSIPILVGYDRFGARRLRSMRARSCRADGH
jgi:hypothetical protein